MIATFITAYFICSVLNMVAVVLAEFFRDRHRWRHPPE